MFDTNTVVTTLDTIHRNSEIFRGTLIDTVPHNDERLYTIDDRHYTTGRCLSDRTLPRRSPLSNDRIPQWVVCGFRCALEMNQWFQKIFETLHWCVQLKLFKLRHEIDEFLVEIFSRNHPKTFQMTEMTGF